MNIKLDIPGLRRRAQTEADKVGQAADDAGNRLSAVELPSIDVAGALGSARRAIGDARRALSDTGDTVAVKAEHAAARAGDIGGGLRSTVDDLRSLRITKDQPRRDPWPGVALIGGIVAGIAAMFLFDPRDGRRRRTMLRDKAGKWSRIAAREVRGTAVDLRNRSQGLVHEAKSAIGATQSGGDDAATADYDYDAPVEREAVAVGTSGSGETGYGEIGHEPGAPNGRPTS